MNMKHLISSPLASSVVLEDENSYSEDIEENKFVEDEILKDWFESND